MTGPETLAKIFFARLSFGLSDTGNTYQAVLDYDTLLRRNPTRHSYHELMLLFLRLTTILEQKLRYGHNKQLSNWVFICQIKRHSILGVNLKATLCYLFK